MKQAVLRPKGWILLSLDVRARPPLGAEAGPNILVWCFPIWELLLNEIQTQTMAL